MRDFFRGDNTQHSTEKGIFVVRKWILLIIILIGMMSLVVQAINLQVFDKEFLQAQGAKRYIREIPISTYRGKIFDRHGEVMAISSPVLSIWLNPQELNPDLHAEEIQEMVELLNLPPSKINLLNDKVLRSKIKFSYLKRRISPELAANVRKLGIKGVYFKREFKRFYPAGAMSAHLVGFTNVNDVGQEGIERAYENHLKGKAGIKRILRDGRRRIIEDFENIEPSIPGKDLVLSIDRRIQYLAFRELQSTFLKYRAKSASLVVLDAKTGDVLAAVSQPAFNPNNRTNLKGRLYRNRVMTDVFEPGSTIKPFVIATALEGNHIAENALIPTKGSYKIGSNWVRDDHNYGALSLTNILKKSSNIAVSKISLLIPSENLRRTYKNLGFGASANIGFPGEAHGSLLPITKWNNFSRATIAFGYGLSSSTLQLARAYTALADDGVLHSVSLLKRTTDPQPLRVFSPEVAKKVRKMLEQVITPGGTGYRARVPGYSVAGKTGTAKKAKKGGYAKNAHFSIFVGMAPANNPRFIIAVMIDEPKDKYYGGVVAAPVFSKVMAGTLRIYGVEPDKTVLQAQ